MDVNEAVKNEVIETVQGLTLEYTKLRDGVPDLRYIYPTDSGMDVYYCPNEPTNLTLRPMQRALVPTGVSVSLQQGTEIQVRPKSGLAWKQGLTVLNTPGTVDEGYTGEVQVILVNLSEKLICIEPFTKIAQLVVCPVLRPTLQLMQGIEDKDRGSNGFGSTGIVENYHRG